MSSATTLVELGDRYAALGLPAAARGAFLRALAASEPDDAIPARRLAELALATGDGDAARSFARAVVERDPGPSSRVLLGRAQLVAGEMSAARMSFSAALNAARVTPLLRARAHLGVAAAAVIEGDRAGAAANAMAAVEAFFDFVGAKDRDPADVDAELTLVEELFARAAATGRADDAAERLAELAARRPEAPVHVLEALLRAERQRAGLPDAPAAGTASGAAEGQRAPQSSRSLASSDADIEAALERELERRPASRATRLRLIERQLRRRYRDQAARDRAIEELEAMAAELAETAPSVAENLDLARVYFLLAATYEDDPGAVDKAEECYRKGLKLRPGHATAANRLALLTLARGDNEAALAEVERALRIDAGHGLAWRNAARVLDASSPGPGLPEVVERLLDAANPGAGTAAGGVAPRLVTATAEVARGDVLAGMYTRGHRLKNLLGIIGSRTRSARKLAGDGELSERLADLEGEVTALYDEWATYLRSMQTEGPVVEVVPVRPLLVEVIEAAAARSPAPIELALGSSLPDLRGDRMMLREALLNIASNACEACADGGQVHITARAVAAGDTPVIEIQVTDSGVGIARGDLARLFAPGFTTKKTGSGVGLAIAERVIAAHHGRILVDSEPGRGTTVTVIVPSDLGGFATLASFPPSRDEVE